MKKPLFRQNFVAVATAALLCWIPAAASQPQTEDVTSVMAGYNRALGVQCDFCHGGTDWKDEGKAPFAIARQMAAMIKALNGTALESTPGVACWTCHAGQRHPSRLPPEALAAEEAKWPHDLATNPSRKLAMSVYSVTLGVSCEYCHVVGQWSVGDKAPYKMVATMVAMFDEFPKYMPPTARTQCWMCHKGSTTPQRQP